MASSQSVGKLDQQILHRRLALNDAVSTIEILRDRLDKETARLNDLDTNSISARLASGRRYLRSIEKEILKTTEESDVIMKLDQRLCNEFCEEAGSFVRDFSSSPQAVAYRRSKRQKELKKLADEWQQIKPVDQSFEKSDESGRVLEERRRVATLEMKLREENQLLENLRKCQSDMERSLATMQRFPVENPILKEKMEKVAKLQAASTEEFVRTLAVEVMDLRSRLFALRRIYGEPVDELPDVSDRGGRGRGRGRGNRGGGSRGRGRGQIARRGPRGSRGSSTQHDQLYTRQCNDVIATAREAGLHSMRQSLITSFMRREYAANKEV